MYESQKNRSIFWRHKRYIVALMQMLKKNRIAIVSKYSNESLHDFRVAVRKLLSLNILFEKTVGFCFGEELKTELKTALHISSQLRDMEELLRFAPELESELDSKIGAHLGDIIDGLRHSRLEMEVMDGYKSVYETVQKEQNKLSHIKQIALEVVIEALKKTSKKYAKIAKDEKTDFDELHYVRKRCKRYRYQLDFLFLDGNEGSPICKRIQDKLGKVNNLRMWMDIVKKDGAVSKKIEAMLENALENAKSEASIFASKEYCESLAVELRRRMAIY
jgi:CHAD domain-containing protein